jgi:hypothetical protein
VSTSTGGTVGTNGNGTFVATNPDQSQGGSGKIDPLARLRQMIGMGVVSSDRKLIGVLAGVEARSGRLMLKIRVSEALGVSPKFVTVQSREMPAESDVIRLRMSLRSFVQQI